MSEETDLAEVHVKVRLHVSNASTTYLLTHNVGQHIHQADTSDVIACTSAQQLTALPLCSFRISKCASGAAQAAYQRLRYWHRKRCRHRRSQWGMRHVPWPRCQWSQLTLKARATSTTATA